MRAHEPCVSESGEDDGAYARARLGDEGARGRAGGRGGGVTTHSDHHALSFYESAWWSWHAVLMVGRAGEVRARGRANDGTWAVHGRWIVCVGRARGGVFARRASGRDDAVSIGQSRSSRRRRRHVIVARTMVCGPGRGAHEVRVAWGVACASGGRVMASVHVGRSEGVRAMAGDGGGEQGRVEAQSRHRRGPKPGAALFWVTRLPGGMVSEIYCHLQRKWVCETLGV